MIVLLLIMIWLSMLCNLWFLFRINMNDDNLDKISEALQELYEQRSEDVKAINIINEHNSKNIYVLAKQLGMKIKKNKK